jgi:hypothetical protein
MASFAVRAFAGEFAGAGHAEFWHRHSSPQTARVHQERRKILPFIKHGIHAWGQRRPFQRTHPYSGSSRILEFAGEQS